MCVGGLAAQGRARAVSAICADPPPAHLDLSSVSFQMPHFISFLVLLLRTSLAPRGLKHLPGAAPVRPLSCLTGLHSQGPAGPTPACSPAARLMLTLLGQPLCPPAPAWEELLYQLREPWPQASPTVPQPRCSDPCWGQSERPWRLLLTDPQEMS